MRSIVRLLWIALKEIFDEASYERYLAQHGVLPTVDSYAGFLQESQSKRERGPRCC